METITLPLKYKDTPIYCWYVPPPIIKGIVILVHGFGEHSGRYFPNVVPTFLKANMAVISYDNIGHGNSGGKRGDCPSYGALLELLHLVVVKGKALVPNTPIFLYGHSMGGNLVLNYALRSKVDLKGVIATSPYLKLAFQPPKWKMVLGKAMLGLFPHITLASGLSPTGISRIPEEVEHYRQDPLVHDRVSPMYSFPVMDAGQWAIDHASQLKTETLLLHGTGDKIIDYKGTESFHNKASVTTLELLEGGYHELHNDLCRKEVLLIISTWLKKKRL
ncbi:Monoacylglycerol lipase [Arenibacter antarcticus]|uniref:Alpha/beta hydrolase n=1 Tax=Arenibacter antarcticus TaxID=2040469 RepID=A0ABW5VI20_9FLAO|nr:alpha/beta hydrolase [Arenibacter sp. H213]MCM4166451.1 alpha/beta hydrolase [Arenibacter sp. H213]